jgi:hypothetical protein
MKRNLNEEKIGEDSTREYCGLVDIHGRFQKDVFSTPCFAGPKVPVIERLCPRSVNAPV